MQALKRMIRQLGIVLLAMLVTHAAVADTVTYFHNDISGSPLAATDDSGNLLWKENYKPYGEKLNQAAPSGSNKIGFHGKAFDDDTGLSYMGARYYDPVIGRFMGVDPVGFQEDSLHSFNRYTYANNNPYKYVDPNGDFAFLAIPAIQLAATAMAAVGALAAGYIAKVAIDTWANGTSSTASTASPFNGVLLPPTNVYSENSEPGERSAQSDSKQEKDEPARGRPWRGEPGSTTDRDAGGNSRRYGNDGFPEVDYDDPHPNEKGVGNGPHTHNWDRPADGGPPTFKDRNISTPYSPLPRR